jgi:riboflavin kinase / FMN adenylyltransferase
MGVFDGVHLGHKMIIDALLHKAETNRADSLLITFDPHPRIVLQKEESELRLITSLEERIERLREDQVDHLLILPFTTQLAALSSKDFIRDYVFKPLHPSAIIVGHDHQFGRQGEGNFSTLRQLGSEFGFETEQVPALEHKGLPISSSRIRQSLLRGNVDEASEMLGYPYYLFGKVVAGNRLGRSLGFPTANIQPSDPHKLIPGLGVYAASASLGNSTYGGMMNIGHRPTLESGDVSIEIHLFDFEGNLYDHDIQVHMHARIRDEMKFPSVEELRQQLLKDEVIARKMLRNVGVLQA